MTAVAPRTPPAAQAGPPPVRRRGPRSDLDVPTVLLDTAERKLGLEGVGVVALRAVGREAGVSPTSVLYHFPNKQVLVEAVFRRRADALGRAVRAQFLTLLASRDHVTTRHVVDAILVPLVEMVNTDLPGGLYWLKTFAQLAQANDPMWLDEVRAAPGLDRLFREVCVRAAPDLHRDDVRTRRGFAVLSMLIALAGTDPTDPDRVGAEGLDPDFVEQLARFTAAGLAAD